jgi:hypothetical protein
MLPATYWIGLGILVLCGVLVTLKNDVGAAHFVILAGFVLYFIGPILFEENPRFADAYWPAGETSLILGTGHIDVATKLIGYQNWPVYHFLADLLVNITGAPLLNIAKYWPLFWAVCFILFTYVCGKRLGCSSRACFLISALSLTAFWLPQTYFQPRTLAFLMYLLILTLLLPFASNSRPWIVLVLLVFSALTLTNGMTPLAAVLIPFLLTQLDKNTHRRYSLQNLISARALPIWLSCIWLSWNVFTVPRAISLGFHEFSSLLQGNLYFAQNPSMLAPLAATARLVALIRYSFLFMLIFLVSLALFLYARERRNKSTTVREIRLLFLWLVGTSLTVVWNYGSDSNMFIITYSFVLVPAILLVGLSFDRRKTFFVLLVTLIVFAALHIPAFYATEATDMVRTSVLYGSHFYASRANPQYIVFGQIPQLVFFYNPDFAYAGQFQVWRSTTELPDFGRINYFLLDAQSHNAFMYSLGEDPVKAFVEAHSWDKLYDNQWFTILAR